MKSTLKQILDRQGILVLDGSMGTALENLGADLNNKLWTARVLADRPELVKEVHIQYFRAGADAGITCSYQASLPGLMETGYSREQAEALITRAVQVFLDARQEWWDAEGKQAGRSWPLCLASAGPYGAYLADGSEYKGHYGVSADTLRDFHRRRAELLWQAGADALLFETEPSLMEAEVEAQIAEELGAPYWISFSCCDGRHNCEGQLLADCARQLARNYPHLQAIGVNCTKPEYITSLIGELKGASDLPIIVYPNSGEEYDPQTKTWHGVGTDRRFGDYALDYMKSPTPSPPAAVPARSGQTAPSSPNYPASCSWLRLPSSWASSKPGASAVSPRIGIRNSKSPSPGSWAASSQPVPSAPISPPSDRPSPCWSR